MKAATVVFAVRNTGNAKYYTETKQNKSISLTIMFHSHACLQPSKSSQTFVLNISDLNIHRVSKQTIVLGITDESFAKQAYRGRHIINKVQSHKTDQYFISQYIVRGTATFDGFLRILLQLNFTLL